MAWLCEAEGVAGAGGRAWGLTRCRDLTPVQKCDQYQYQTL